MTPENTWRRVRCTIAGAERTVLISGVFDGTRLFCEKQWGAPDADGKRSLLRERFYTTDPARAHSSAAIALAAAMEPVENNNP